MTTYLNAVRLANNGYFLSFCPMDDDGCPLDPTFFQRHPALETVLVLAFDMQRMDTLRTELGSGIDFDTYDPYSRLCNSVPF